MALWRRGGFVVVGGPFLQRGVLGPAGRGGHSGRTKRAFLLRVWFWANPTTNKTPVCVMVCACMCVMVRVCARA